MTVSKYAVILMHQLLKESTKVNHKIVPLTMSNPAHLTTDARYDPYLSFLACIESNTNIKFLMQCILWLRPYCYLLTTKSNI